MKTKPKHLRHFYDFLLTVAILAIATILCTLLRRLDDGSGYVNLIFVLAVACISRWTEGFFWGTFSSVSAVLFVNFVFTYPYWAFNFTITGYPLTFLAMLTVSIMISAMNTQIKKQEKLRLETEKEAVRANLLRAMSHDIRTPLTSIVGNTAAILDNEDSFSPEQKRRLLEDVNEDAQWLIRMVENLLSITRMSGGQAKIEKECEAAEEIVAVSVSKFTKRFPNIQVTVEVPDEVLMVPMDATLIRQVMMNLLENAAIHGGNVTQIRFQLSREGSSACFAISDNGIGIPKEKLPTIFDGGLSGVSHNNFDMKKNMGIGLSVCYTIVKAHGGTMTAEIWNQAERASVSICRWRRASTVKLKDKVLVVEDEQNISNFISTVLTANGFDVLMAQTGAEAISMITSHCPDLIILDLGLPDMDGMNILKEVRSWSNLPIIVVSARTHESDKVTALDFGADDYIEKPFGTSELLARIRTAIRHTRTPLDNGEIAQSGKFTVRDLTIDYDKHHVLVDGQDVHLTLNEFKIVALLGKYAGKVLTYDYLIKQIWGPKAKADNQILRVNMANIRRKIEKNPASPEYIFTEIGVGYRMLENEA